MSSRGSSPFAAESPELAHALDEGETAEMPDNVAPGILSERPVDIRKVDTFQYRDDAGVVQENTAAVRLMLILALYLMVITAPAALWLLWRDRSWSRTQKAIGTALMALGYAIVAARVLG